MAGCFAGAAPAEPSVFESNRPHARYRASFVRCYDGDTCTFHVHLGLGVTVLQNARLYGIDTPEMRGAERQRAIEVRDFVIRALQGAHKIELLVPQKRSCSIEDEACDERGKYGRLLVNVLMDGQSLNALLLTTGRAVVY